MPWAVPQAQQQIELQLTLTHSLYLLLLLLLLLLSLLLLLVVLLITALMLPRDNTQRASECRARAKGGLEEELTGRKSRLAGHQNRLQNRAPPFKLPLLERRRRLTNLVIPRRDRKGRTT